MRDWKDGRWNGLWVIFLSVGLIGINFFFCGLVIIGVEGCGELGIISREVNWERIYIIFILVRYLIWVEFI